MRVHLVEQGGRGGVFQHTVALARLLGNHGLDVRLHTASDPELDPTGPGVEMCGCVEWFRGRRARRPHIASHYVSHTLPHLVADVARSDVAHVQGTWNPVLTPLTVGLLRGRGCRTVVSPHNTFARSGSHLHERLLRLDCVLANAVIVFSEFDAAALGRRGVDSVVSPLIQLLPDTASADDWRETWGVGSGPVVLFAGQLRPDKGLDRVIRALRDVKDTPLLAVVGEDKGALGACRTLAENEGVAVHWSIGFQPLDRFVAAIRAANVVVCPYVRASQSGVLSIASTLGVRTVATAVGGLAEAADTTVDAEDGAALATALETALSGPRPSNGSSAGWLDAAWRAHARAYALETEQGSPAT